MEQSKEKLINRPGESVDPEKYYFRNNTFYKFFVYKLINLIWSSNLWRKTSAYIFCNGEYINYYN